MEKEPRRLKNKQYFIEPSLPFNIYSQTLTHHYELHWHEFYELSFIIAGRGTNIVNGVPCPLSAGHLFLLTPADFHEVFPDEEHPLRLYNVIFPEECFHEDLYRWLFGYGTRLEATMNDDFEAVASDFACLADEYNNRRPGCERMGRVTLERILVRLARACADNSQVAPPHPDSARYPHVHHALIYIRHHFREPITLESAAKQAGLAPNYFSGCFRSMTGVTFQHYLQEVRLNFAKNLLKASLLPVTEICYASGFNTLHHFEKTFKRSYGFSPQAWRKLKQH